MHLFLTGVLPFLAHDHGSAAAFLTCRHHNFHASIIPEFLSDEERVKCFCETRQQNQLRVDNLKQYSKVYTLFVRTPLMQFSPSLLLRQVSILEPLLETKYFSRSLQRCSVLTEFPQPVHNNILHGLSKVRFLTKLDLGQCEVTIEQLEIIINSFLSLEIFSIRTAYRLKILDPSQPAIKFSSPPPATTKTLRSLTMHRVNALFAAQFIPHFPNLRKLTLSGSSASEHLNLRPLSSSLPLLKEMTLTGYTLENTESLKNLVHLSSLRFEWCHLSDDLSFLSRENTVPELTTLHMFNCEGLSTDSFASLSHARNLQVLKLTAAGAFTADCLQYLENMTHLRKLDLCRIEIAGESQSLKTLMQNLLGVEELKLEDCRFGTQGAISRALYNNKHSRLRVLNLDCSDIVDDDLKGIDALKNTLEVLDLNANVKLTKEALMHCKDLVKLKILNLRYSHGIDDLSPLKDCLNLEELDVSGCRGLTDDSFKVFSEEPNSFAKLRVLNMSNLQRFTETVFEHLSKNNNLVCQLKELGAGGLSEIFSSSATARNNIYKLKGLRRLKGIVHSISASNRNKVAGEMMRNLINLEEIR